jgi:hypothetical protein
MGQSRIDLAVAEQLLGVMQHYPSRDRVELIVDLGLDWDRLAPTVEALVDDGYLVRLDDHRDVYSLATASHSVSVAGIAAS